MEKNNIEHILIVDDEEDICFLLKSILKRNSDAQIDICNSVSCAKERLRSSSKYDLAFIDMRLNDGTGDEVVEFVRQNKKEQPYIAIISAYSSEIDKEHLNSLEINEFIPKPLTTQKIINCYYAASA
jgi:CheY-like chemotaxis protein